MKKIIIIIALLFSVIWIQAQSVQFRVINSSGNPVTGLTSSNIKFLKSPYSFPADLVTETITVTEVGSQGNYTCTGFTVFQLVELWIDSVKQSWFGRQYAGIPSNTFMSKIGNVTDSINGAKYFTGNVQLDTLIMAGILNANSNRIANVSDPVNNQDAVTKAWILANTITSGNLDSVFTIRSNTLIVDSRLAADIAGKQYNDISSAITYAGSVTGSGTQWTIYIFPHYSGTYTESVSLPDYVHLTGIGEVTIHGAFARTGSVALGSKIENLFFYMVDANYVIARTRIYNCVFETLVDAVSGGTITITSSRIKNSGFYPRYDDVGDDLISGGTNVIINCWGNFDVSWQSTDRVFGYSFDDTPGITY